MSTSIWRQSAGTTLRSCTISTATKASGCVRDILRRFAQLADGAARLRRNSVMSCRTSQILALTILVPATISGSPGHAQENFKLLGEKEIRAGGSRQGHHRQLSLGELS